MTISRRIALWGGIAYLLTFVAAIPALPLLEPVTAHPDYVLGAGSDGQVVLGGLLEVVAALAGIATALILYPVIRRVSRTSALGFLSSRIVEAGILIAGAISVLTVVTLRQDLGDDAPAGLVTVAQALIDVREWTFLLGPGLFPAINAGFLGIALYRAGLVPRILPLVGFVGAPFLVGKTLAVAFGAFDELSTAAVLLALPIAAWELGLGLWLTVKGFHPSPILSPDRSGG